MKETPARILYDEKGNPVLVEHRGQRFPLATHDAEAVLLLQSIDRELRYIRIAVCEAFDIELTPEDVDDERNF